MKQLFLNAKVSELETKASELNEQLSTLRSEYENKVEEIENSISSLNSSLSEVDKKYQDEIKRIEDDYNEKINSLKSDYDTKLASVNEALASLTEKDKEIIERLTTLEEQVAKLLEINTYTVTFDPNNGQSSFTQIVNEYSLIEKPISPTLTGYTFVSWVDGYDDPWFFGQSLVVKDITLRAKYVGNTYKITLDANGGTCNDDYVFVTYNSSYSLPKAFKDGFTFRGWTYNDEDVIDTTSFQFTNDVTYVARFSRPYSVSFDSNGGSFVESITYDDWIIDNLPTPTKDGFRFGGWYIGTTKIENGYKNVEQVDLTLKASWINAASLFEYQEIDDEVTILKYVGSYTDVEIPSTIEGKNVTSIDVNAFKNNLNLTSVKFNRNLTSIPDGLLEGQENIKTLGIFIDINTTLRKLFNVTSQSKLPASLENIEYSYISIDPNDWSRFFNGVSKAYNFTIPYNGNDYLPSFKDCINLKNLSYPIGYNLMYDYAFQGCTNLTSINIPEGVTSIDYGIFSGCSSLTSINIPEGVTNIGGSSFSGCSSLTSINIPEGVTSIGNSAFSSCSSLISINIPESVTIIGESAFSSCSSLISINIPESVTSIGEHAFFGCSSLTSINIPENVTNIGNSLFYGCSSLTSINIPESVTSIGNMAFYGCSSLTSINIPEGVTSIGNSAFAYCSSLTSITIPNGVTNIGGNAFFNCHSLTSITIPHSVTSIGSYKQTGGTLITQSGVFWCRNLDITYDGTMEEWNLLVNGKSIGIYKSVICTDGIITQ